MPEKKQPPSTDLQISILEEILKGNIEKVSYHHPKKQLEKTGRRYSYDEIINAFLYLEQNQIARLNTALKFRIFKFLPAFHTRCGYEITDRKKAREMYNSMISQHKKA